MIKFFLFMLIIFDIVFAFYNLDMFKVISSLLNSPTGVFLVSLMASCVLLLRNNKRILIGIFLIFTILFVWVSIK